MIQRPLLTFSDLFIFLPSFFRTVLKHDAAHSDVEILEPINLELLVKRNLAATWYNKIPGMEVNGVLMSMNVSFS